MSESVKYVIDAFYNKFLLRDFMAKVVPGTIFLYCAAAEFSPKELSWLLDSSTWQAWMLVLGLAWVTGFALQAIGELAQIIRYYPRLRRVATWRRIRWPFRPPNERREWYEYLFSVRSDPKHGEHREQIERMVVIKEATGNSAVALLSTSPFVVSSHGVISPATITLGIAIVILVYMHRTHVNRQCEMLHTIKRFPGYPE